MNRVYYVREYTAGSGTLMIDAAAYETVDAALVTIFKHLRTGGVVKGWIEDQDGVTVMLPDDVNDRYRAWLNSN